MLHNVPHCITTSVWPGRYGHTGLVGGSRYPNTPENKRQNPPCVSPLLWICYCRARVNTMQDEVLFLGRSQTSRTHFRSCPRIWSASGTWLAFRWMTSTPCSARLRRWDRTIGHSSRWKKCLFSQTTFPSGLFHTGRRAPCQRYEEILEPMVHKAYQQHQRIWVQICLWICQAPVKGASKLFRRASATRLVVSSRWPDLLCFIFLADSHDDCKVGEQNGRQQEVSPRQDWGRHHLFSESTGSCARTWPRARRGEKATIGCEESRPHAQTIQQWQGRNWDFCSRMICNISRLLLAKHSALLCYLFSFRSQATSADKMHTKNSGSLSLTPELKKMWVFFVQIWASVCAFHLLKNTDCLSSYSSDSDRKLHCMKTVSQTEISVKRTVPKVLPCLSKKRATRQEHRWCVTEFCPF